MKALVLAAGLGTRLKPWTLSHPKALVPVGGIPMLERVIRKLESRGFNRIVVNIHHFGEQIIEFLDSRQWRAEIQISDERDCLLDTGGAIVKAASLLCSDSSPVLVHNVDILSDVDLNGFMDAHIRKGADASLLVNDRESSRKLMFDDNMRLRAWTNRLTGEMRGEFGDWSNIYAFSGIHAVSTAFIQQMVSDAMPKAFPIMDYYLTHTLSNNIYGIEPGEPMHLIDIGKPETLMKADMLFND